MYVLVKTPTTTTEKSESYTFNDVYDLLTRVAAMVKEAAAAAATVHPAKESVEKPVATVQEKEKEKEKEEEEEQEEKEEAQEEKEEAQEEDNEDKGTPLSVLEEETDPMSRIINSLKRPIQDLPLSSRHMYNKSEYPKPPTQPPILDTFCEPLFTGPIDREKNTAEIMERIKQMEAGTIESQTDSQTKSLDKIIDYFTENFLENIDVKIQPPWLCPSDEYNYIFKDMPILTNACYDLFVAYPHKFIENSHELETIKEHIHYIKYLLGVDSVYTRIQFRKYGKSNPESGYMRGFIIKQSAFTELTNMIYRFINEQKNHGIVDYKDAVEICYKTLNSMYDETLVGASVLDDWIALFVKTKLSRTMNGSLQSSIMYSTFAQWLQNSAPQAIMKFLSIQYFSKVMKETHGFETGRKSSGVFYKNVEWKSSTTKVEEQSTAVEKTTSTINVSGWNPQTPFEDRWAPIDTAK